MENNHFAMLARLPYLMMICNKPLVQTGNDGQARFVHPHTQSSSSRLLLLKSLASSSLAYARSLL